MHFEALPNTNVDTPRESRKSDSGGLSVGKGAAE